MGLKGVTTMRAKFQLNIKILVLNIDQSKIEKKNLKKHNFNCSLLDRLILHQSKSYLLHSSFPDEFTFHFCSNPGRGNFLWKCLKFHFQVKSTSQEIKYIWYLKYDHVLAP